ncbi:hypothetical protein LCGC14_2038680 [marine sediment metagenome]|uniref:DUF1508 domain-containing protein n=1 Tax=marine sediment metagenome TaxID=412755 RepID=A0A0F9FF56_9ZZZZ
MKYLLVLKWTEDGTYYELAGTCDSEAACKRTVKVIKEIMRDANCEYVTEMETDEVKSK